MCGLVCPVLHVYIRMSLVIGSIPTPLTWHGLWLRLIEDTTTARGALASAQATRMAAPTAHDPPQAIPLKTAQNTLKHQEVRKIQREAPPSKPIVDNKFDLNSARQVIEEPIKTSLLPSSTSTPPNHKSARTQSSPLASSRATPS
jgi:hypothetical protein